MKRTVVLLGLLAVSHFVFSQKEVNIDRNTSFLDRVYVGGGLGFSTGSQATYISVSPVVGYMITKDLSAGVGVNYQYVKYKDFDISNNIYGGNLFVRHNIQQFFLQGEYNLVNYELTPFDDADNRTSTSRVLFGGGISQPLGRRGSLNIMGLYDFTYKENGPFASPWVFRVFFAI